VATSLERLEGARAEVLAAEGVDFLRRLAEYVDLLNKDEMIRTAVAEVRREVEDADALLGREDAGFVARLVPIREQLAEREHEADDAAVPRPGPYNGLDPASARAFHDWMFTLANFDAIAEDRKEQVNPERGGDQLNQSRTQKLVAILNAKLYDRVFPFNERPAPRPDLMPLYDEMNEIGHEQTNSYRKLERLADQNGYFGLIWLEAVGESLQPRDSRPLKSPEDKINTLEEALTKPDLFRLYEVMRPKEGRGGLSDSDRERIGRLEETSRRELDRLHRPLKKRLEEQKAKGWRSRVPRMFGRLGMLPPVLGFIADAFTVVVLVVVVVGAVGHFAHLW
jgi:hypothetical protein